MYPLVKALCFVSAIIFLTTLSPSILLIYIHPFPNGNGRLARLMADLLIEQQMGGQRFSWG
ncbi:MAG: Fic family protein, partial [Desulfobulbaceae bacterium]|nr:Fic family protein [Desulfobulbaceae bacterium]